MPAPQTNRTGSPIFSGRSLQVTVSSASLPQQLAHWPVNLERLLPISRRAPRSCAAMAQPGLISPV
jgi:hypothetical protein